MSLGVLAPKSPDLKRYFVGGGTMCPPLTNRVKALECTFSQDKALVGSVSVNANSLQTLI